MNRCYALDESVDHHRGEDYKAHEEREDNAFD